MFNKMKNIFEAKNLALGLAIAGAVVSVVPVHAAADSDLTAQLATGTSMISDNKGTIMAFFASVIVLVFVIAAAKRGLGWASAKGLSAISGKRKKR